MSIIEDMSNQIWVAKPEQLQKLLSKLGIVAQKLQYVFEIKSNIILIKDQEISYLRNLGMVLR